MTWPPERPSRAFWPKSSTSWSHGREQGAGGGGSLAWGPSTADSGSCMWSNRRPSAAGPVVNQPGACISTRTLRVTPTQRPGHSCYTQPQQLPLPPWNCYSLPSHPASPSNPSGCSCGWQIRLQKGATTAHTLCARSYRTICPGCPPIGIQEAWSKSTCLDMQKGSTSIEVLASVSLYFASVQ